MKQRFLIILLAVFTFPVFISAADNPFVDALNKYDGKYDINSVNLKGVSFFFTKLFFYTMMPDDVPYAIQKLKSVNILTLHKTNSSSGEYYDLEKAGSFPFHEYDLYLEVVEHNDNILFYTKRDKMIIKEILLFVSEDDDITLIRLCGNFNASYILKDLAKLHYIFN